MDTRQALSHIRSLLKSDDRSTIQQGIELAVTLGNDEVTRTLRSGLYVSPHGSMQVSQSSEVKRRVHRLHQGWAAIEIAHRLGVFDGVETLRLDNYPFADLEIFRDHPTLTTLGISGWNGPLTDLSALAGLPLTSLVLRGAHRLTDLSPLAQIPTLTALRLVDLDAVADLSPLAGLTDLTTLVLWSVPKVTDLTPLAGLTGLTSLELRDTDVADLAPLRGLTGLTFLALDNNTQLADLRPVDGLTGLRQLMHHGTAVTEAEARRSACARVRIVDGEPHHGRRKLTGSDLVPAMLPGPHLTGLTTVNLDHSSITTLDALADHPTITAVSAVGCKQLTDVYGLIPLTNLTRIDLSGSTQAKPRPSPTELVGRAAVAGYQAKLARSLKKRTSRTPQQEAWLAAHAAAPTPAQGGRTPLNLRQMLDRIRPMLKSGDPAQMLQAVELVIASGDEALLKRMSRGLYLYRDVLVVSDRSPLHTHVSHGRRGWVAGHLARRIGMLDGLTSLKLSASDMPDLGFLDGLTALETLTVSSCRSLTDLSPLASLTGLTELRLTTIGSLTDLSPLASLTRLTELHLTAGWQLTDVSPLARLTALTRLTLWRMPKLHDLSPLAHRTGLTALTLWDMPKVTDITALTRLTRLTQLFITDIRGVTDLSPLSGMSALTDLRIKGTGVVDLSPIDGLTGLSRLDTDHHDPLPFVERRRSDIARMRLVGGEPHHGSTPLRGRRLAEVTLPGSHLNAATTLAYDGSAIATLSALSGCTQLAALSLADCKALTDVYALIGLRTLASLDLSGATAVKPRPKRARLTDLAAVTAYRTTLARSLKRKQPGHPLVAAAVEEGLIPRRRGAKS